MGNKKVISRKNLPTKPPTIATVVAILALDYWNAPQWLWGALGVVFVIIWVAWIVQMFQEKQFDIFKDKSE